MSFSLDLPEVTTIDPAGSYIIIDGNDVTVICAASGGKPDVYEYIFRQLNTWTSWSSTDAKDYSGLNRDKAGEYKCQSRNYVGNGPTQTFQLVVHCKYPYVMCIHIEHPIVIRYDLMTATLHNTNVYLLYNSYAIVHTHL